MWCAARCLVQWRVTGQQFMEVMGGRDPWNCPVLGLEVRCKKTGWWLGDTRFWETLNLDELSVWRSKRDSAGDTTEGATTLQCFGRKETQKLKLCLKHRHANTCKHLQIRHVSGALQENSKDVFCFCSSSTPNFSSVQWISYDFIDLFLRYPPCSDTPKPSGYD